MEYTDRIKELKEQGFYCSQIIMIMALDLQGKNNPDLVRSMNGLTRGLGDTGEICGALTAAACVIGLYAGKGLPEEEEDPRVDFMVQDLVNWFKETNIHRFGGIRCEEILTGDISNRLTRCPLLVAETFQKVKELLVENGYDLSGIQV